MNRNYFILYSIILGLIICMCLMYVRMYPSIESFSSRVVFNGETLTSKYKREDGQDNTPCHSLKITINKKDLEKWFVGKDGEKPLLRKFLAFMKAIKLKCGFKEIFKALDDVGKSKERVMLLAEMVKDIDKILKTIQKNIIGKLLKEYEKKRYDGYVSGFAETFASSSPYLEVSDITEEEISEGCKNLEKLILVKYLTTNTLKYGSQIINGIEGLLCECHKEVKAIREDIKSILERMHKNKPDPIEYVIADLEQIKNTFNAVEDTFFDIKRYVSAKAADLNLQAIAEEELADASYCELPENKEQCKKNKKACTRNKQTESSCREKGIPF